MANFTPGIWHMAENGIGGRRFNLIQIYATNEDLEMICQVWKDGLLVGKEQDYQANARLIAAAPEMYSILRSILDDEYNNVWDVKDECNRILAKINTP